MLKTKEEIEQWLNTMAIQNYYINDNFTVSVKGDVDLRNKLLDELPVKFDIVYGDFIIDNNNLTSLKGSPNRVTKSFSCSYNKLTSLKYLPHKMDYLFLMHNQISSLSELNDIEIIFSVNLRHNQLKKITLEDLNKLNIGNYISLSNHNNPELSFLHPQFDYVNEFVNVSLDRLKKSIREYELKKEFKENLDQDLPNEKEKNQQPKI